MSASSFNYFLPNINGVVKISLPSDLTEEELLNFPAFVKWITTLTRSLALQNSKAHKFNSSPYKIEKIDVQSIVRFGPDKVGFIKIQATIKNERGEWIPGAVFLRGGSVAMLMILQPDDAKASTEDDKWVILTVQPRVAAGSLAFAEIPAGMIDNSNSFTGTAANEIAEETDIKVMEEELINMSALAAPQSTTTDWKSSTARGIKDPETETEPLEIATYPSPGACDEYIPTFLYQKRLPRDILNALRDRETGLHAEGEKITLKLVRLENLWRECSRDGKSLAAFALYEGLRKEGKIPKIEELSAEKLGDMRTKLAQKNNDVAKM
ncbi:nudix hydrolase 14 [Melanomma pulvis-pyrius CBS 109.77]|uniref:Nudix hydrolase 14 n=1 Tax=Melanomma pulvis-pyrius CBS 109.77 TaxID=1314802 RepID=A0A6A6XD62_9PLEO|nr:nudix hydrolase 14 [Melanomma pulvis-pyrius CBS 109.77]